MQHYRHIIMRYNHALVLLSLIYTVISVAYSEICTSSSQCRGCCRTETGNDVLPPHKPIWPTMKDVIIEGNDVHNIAEEAGQCGRLSQKGERCIPGTCSCQSGLTCYSVPIGCFCPPNPHRCYDSKWVEERRRSLWQPM